MKDKIESPNWRTIGERCPRCGDRMIENRTGIECSAMHCDYRKTGQDPKRGWLGNTGMTDSGPGDE